MPLKHSSPHTSKPHYPFWGRLIAASAVAIAVQSTLGAAQAQQPRVFPTDITNIAAAANGGRIISASSTLDNDAQFNANNLIDGKNYNAADAKSSAGWVSNRFDPLNMDTVTIGFADNAVRKIGKIALNPVSAVAPERWAKDIELQVSTESAEGPYQAVAQLTLRRAAERQEFVFLPANARFVRLMFRSNWGSDRAVGLGEVEVYEAIGQTDAMGNLIGRLEGAVGELKRYRQTQIEGGGGPANPVAGATGAASGAARDAQFGGLDEATVQLIQLATGDAAPTLAVSKTNVAAAANGGRIVDFSSQFISVPAQGVDPDFAPTKLIDGSNYKGEDKGSFGWASQGFTPGKQFVTIGFADDRSKLVSKFIINPSSNQSDLRWARRIDVQVSNDSAKKGPFRTVGTFTIRPENSNQEFTIRPTEAKYVRFLFMANGPGGINLPNVDPDVNSDRAVSLGEIEIYEATSNGDALDSLIGRFEQVLVDLKRLRSQQATKTAAAEADLSADLKALPIQHS